MGDLESTNVSMVSIQRRAEMRAARTSDSARRSVEVVILAGGLSERMGRDKARLRLGGRSLLSILRQVSREAGLPCRVLRRDTVKRCGPLGGILTALTSSKHEACLFLSCDMPFITPVLLREIVRSSRGQRTARFCNSEGRRGFPALIWQDHLRKVQNAINAQQFSIQSLAQRIRARTPRSSAGSEDELFNVNTPEEWRTARRLWAERG